MFAFGSGTDVLGTSADVRFTPRKRTLTVGMSALGQKQTYALQQTTAVIQLPRQRVQAVPAEGLIRSLWLS
jgi:hypothetical protein